MGLNYAFLLLCAADRVDAVLGEIAGMADEETAERIRASLPWQPAETLEAASAEGRTVRLRLGAKGLEPHGPDCLSLRFAADAELLEYARDDLPREPGPWWKLGIASPPPLPEVETVDVGCIFLAVTAGERYAEVELSAATTRMSVLFSRSASVRAAMSGIVERAGGLVALFDDESHDFEPLSAPGTRVSHGFGPYLVSDDVYQRDVDQWIESLLAEIAAASESTAHRVRDS